MRLPLASVVVLCACAAPEAGPPIRLVGGTADTVVVNGRHPTTLGVHALDAAGRAVTSGLMIRYESSDARALPVTANGAATCTRSGDFAVRAVEGRLATRLVVLCRLVEYVRIPGPLQFVLGDSTLSRPLAVPLVAYGADGRPTAPFGASLGIKDASIATLHGLILSPRSRGITTLGAHAGDRDVGIGVHVYQRVGAAAALDTLLRVPDRQRLFAVPLRLGPGEVIRQRLPPGDWMLAMLPEAETAPDRIQLRVEGARCRDHLLNAPRRWGCHVDADATVILYRPYVSAESPVATGYLLVRWLFS